MPRTISLKYINRQCMYIEWFLYNVSMKCKCVPVNTDVIAAIANETIMAGLTRSIAKNSIARCQLEGRIELNPKTMRSKVDKTLANGVY